MKRTAIHYRDMGDKVEIISIENAATKRYMGDIIGAEATHKYLSGKPCYFEAFEGIYVYTDQGGEYILRPGSIWYDSSFGHIVQTMKAAVDRLQRIRKEHEQSQIKKVII